MKFGEGGEKPIFLRWWFYVPVLTFVVACFVLWAAVVWLESHYERKAEAFDLGLMAQMEAASVIFDREGHELGKIFIQNRQPVPLDKVAPMMVNAVIAAEDNKFYKHKGVDYAGVLRAAISNYRQGKITQGASTVTQQLARNTFDLRDRTYQRKLVEMFLAQRIEMNFPKDKIMEFYLNRVYFGSGFYGVEAAARGYFGKAAIDLDIGQCAMLAGLLKSPQALSPWNSRTSATQARDFVLKRMKEQGFLSSPDYTEQVALPLYVMKRTNPFKVSYAIDYIRQQAIVALGYDRAMNGGFRIYTTLDSGMQKAAERAVRESLIKVESRPGYTHLTFEAFKKSVRPIEDEINRGNMAVKVPEPRYLQGAVVAFENRTGAVLALVGGRDFKHSEYNRATMARRPAGTAFVPFVYAAAFDKGVFPGETVEDGCLDNRYVMVGGESGILGEWGVEQENNDYEGRIPARDALVKGKNAATVRLGMRVGLDAVRKVARGAGIESPLRNYSNTFLGSSEVTLDELTLAYMIFPNGGFRPRKPFIISRIANADSTEIFRASTQKVKVISPEAAWQVGSALEQVLRTSPAAIAFRDFGLKEMQIAGKSGTAYNFTDTYFIGYNSAVTCGVWVGFDKPTKIFRGAFGKDLALPVWVKTMNAAAEAFPPAKFARPDTLKEVEICRSSGLLGTAKCEGTVYSEYGTEKEIPKIRCDIHGGGIRNYAKNYEQEEWPKAAAAIDLATIRPIAVVAPTLLGLNDVYGAIKPAAQRFDDDSIPVARAVAAKAEDEVDLPGVAQAVAVTPIADPEIRKAEAVKPLDSPFDLPAIQPPTPAPIEF